MTFHPEYFDGCVVELGVERNHCDRCDDLVAFADLWECTDCGVPMHEWCVVEFSDHDQLCVTCTEFRGRHR